MATEAKGKTTTLRLKQTDMVEGKSKTYTRTISEVTPTVSDDDVRTVGNELLGLTELGQDTGTVYRVDTSRLEEQIGA